MRVPTFGTTTFTGPTNVYKPAFEAGLRFIQAQFPDTASNASLQTKKDTVTFRATGGFFPESLLSGMMRPHLPQNPSAPLHIESDTIPRPQIENYFSPYLPPQKTIVRGPSALYEEAFQTFEAEVLERSLSPTESFGGNVVLEREGDTLRLVMTGGGPIESTMLGALAGWLYQRGIGAESLSLDSTTFSPDEMPGIRRYLGIPAPASG